MGTAGAKVWILENAVCPLTKKHFCHTGICDEYDRETGKCRLLSREEDEKRKP